MKTQDYRYKDQPYNNQHQAYKALELVSDCSSASHPQSYDNSPMLDFQSSLRQVVKSLPVGNAESHLWQSFDWAGFACWHLYDPLTGQTLDLNSRNDVRTWLDRQFAL